MAVNRMRSALIVVDVQNDFVPGVSVSALPVPGGDQIIRPINDLMAAAAFDAVVFTQDWHPAGHDSFASSGKGGPWPDHCVQGSWGAQFEPFLDTSKAHLILRKGMNPRVDSYSAFQENDRLTDTGLGAWLKARHIRSVYVCGLALDFCVRWTCQDAREEGFNVYLHQRLTRAVHPANDAETLDALTERGVHILGDGV
jgi:nicotinamidase/pyrazinamidase